MFCQCFIVFNYIRRSVVDNPGWSANSKSPFAGPTYRRKVPRLCPCVVRNNFTTTTRVPPLRVEKFSSRLPPLPAQTVCKTLSLWFASRPDSMRTLPRWTDLWSLPVAGLRQDPWVWTTPFPDTDNII